MDPAFIDGQTQEYTAASGTIIIVAVQAGRGLFFLFYRDNGRDVGALRHARQQMFFNAVTSPRVSETQKSENHISAGKVMVTIFWDSNGVLCMDFLKEHRTINAECYSALLEGPVKTAIRNKRKRAQTSVSFLQDNTNPHMAAHTTGTIQKLKWNVLPHPPYSPDLASSAP